MIKTSFNNVSYILSFLKIVYLKQDDKKVCNQWVSIKLLCIFIIYDLIDTNFDLPHLFIINIIFVEYFNMMKIYKSTLILIFKKSISIKILIKYCKKK